MQKKALYLAAALFALLLAPVASFAAPGGGGGNPADILNNPKALARFLRLTPAQIEQQKALLTTLHNTVEPLRDAAEPLQASLKTALAAASPNACAVGDIVVDLDEIHDDIAAARAVYDTAFSAILTPEQLTKYNALKALVGALRESDES